MPQHPRACCRHEAHVRRALTGIALAAALLAGVDFAAWEVATARLASGMQALLANMRSNGWTVRTATARSGGWPLAATLFLGDVQVDGGGAVLPGGLSWSAERLALSVSLVSPWHILIRPHGEETLRLSHLPAIVFTAGRLEARLPLGGRVGQADLTAQDLAGGLQSSRRREDVRVGRLAVHGQAEQSRGGVDAALAFQASGVGLPDTGRWPLGGTVSRLAADATLISPPVTGATSRDQAQSWHDGVGFLRVHALDLRWGPLALAGDAQFGLDGRLQPAGHGTVRVTGYAPALDALAAAHVIGPGMAATYKAVLDLMAPAPSDDGALSLPLDVRDDTLSVGRIPVARFADVKW